MKYHRSSVLITLVTISFVFLTASTRAERPPRPSHAPTRAAAPHQTEAVPGELLGDWFWGTISPTRYWNRDTGEFVGHGYGGALSYVFEKDGTYRRYFYMETRLGGDVSGLFSESTGTVTFTGDTFTLKPKSGTYRFTEGKSKKRERAMTQDELERPGLIYTWRLEKGEAGKPPVMKVAKPGEEPREFSRSKE